MSKKIYKYIGPSILNIAFSNSGFIGLKCSYPKDYNDPYELFLTIDQNIKPEILAYYQEVIGKIPQRPTTCFSNLPIVTPMWAHYAHNLSGFVIEIDEEKLKNALNDISIGDIKYKDQIDSSISTTLHHAHGTLKPRHTFFLGKEAYSTAYFTKNILWSYESERRVVVTDDDITIIDDNMILFIPTECVSAIISGTRTSQRMKESCINLCDTLSFEYFEMQIGRSYPTPYFIDKSNTSYMFINGSIVRADLCCETCNEPIVDKKDRNIDKCPWCAIRESHQFLAARSNPLRMLDRQNRLESYLTTCEEMYKAKPTEDAKR